MYVNIKYKYEAKPGDETRKERLDLELEKAIGEKNSIDDEYIEMFQHFETQEELDYHCDLTKQYIFDTIGMVVTNVEVEHINKEYYLERLTFRLKHAICKRYAASKGIEFKSIRDENNHCRDKRFLIEAYTYLLDFLEVYDEPFKKFENDSNEMS